MLKISPLAPANPPALPPISGVKMATMNSGVKYTCRDDILLMTFESGSVMAGVVTKSKTRSAPVEHCVDALAAGGGARGLVVNSGNANAFTGRAGDIVVTKTIETAAEVLGCAPTDIYVSSTGVIGEPVPFELIPKAVRALNNHLSDNDWEKAGAAILTTDTFVKVATRSAKIGGVQVTLNGIVKGSGMIAPDMATMLGYIATDAAIPQPVLQTLLTNAVNKSFNCITVDSDTSTSDTVLLAATGKAGNTPPTAAGDRTLKDFKRALQEICIDLAQQVVRDGEGASKFIAVRVTGATSTGAAKTIGLAIANSPLVKTAIAGEDANWGRIVMAVGKSGAKADRDLLRIAIGGVEI
ncbi:MAG: bifunctional glutamate N-acetyltransferase/amino-acid acetyltransferase ArgJ, partial [Alphaproteobacteria bacterium]